MGHLLVLLLLFLFLRNGWHYFFEANIAVCFNFFIGDLAFLLFLLRCVSLGSCVQCCFSRCHLNLLPLILLVFLFLLGNITVFHVCCSVHCSVSSFGHFRVVFVLLFLFLGRLLSCNGRFRYRFVSIFRFSFLLFLFLLFLGIFCSFLNSFSHNFNILPREISSFVKLQPVSHLLLQLRSKNGRTLLTEAVNSAGNTALVSQIP